jgi:hypothetical protein
MLIHVNRTGEQFGPYTIEDLNAYLAQGSILPSDQAWYEGAAGWMPMDQVPGVVLPGASAVYVEQPFANDPLAAADPAVAIASAGAMSAAAQGAKKKKILVIAGAITGVVVLAGGLCFVWFGFFKSGGDAGGGTSVNDGGNNKFSATVEPIFKNSTCYDCHDGTGDEKVKGKFDLTKSDSVMNAIEPGKPDESEIIVRLTDKDDPMPPEGKGDMLSESDIGKVKAWIAAGGKF